MGGVDYLQHSIPSPSPPPSSLRPPKRAQCPRANGVRHRRRQRGKPSSPPTTTTVPSAGSQAKQAKNKKMNHPYTSPFSSRPLVSVLSSLSRHHNPRSDYRGKSAVSRHHRRLRLRQPPRPHQLLLLLLYLRTQLRPNHRSSDTTSSAILLGLLLL